jgi:hypothetical protein
MEYAREPDSQRHVTAAGPFLFVVYSHRDVTGAWSIGYVTTPSALWIVLRPAVGWLSEWVDNWNSIFQL